MAYRLRLVAVARKCSGLAECRGVSSPAQRPNLSANDFSMLTIRDLKMSLGGRVLFENASFQVNYGDRVALVGPNGAGKTTLFSIILKQREPDSGTVSRDEWTMVGHLPQEAEAH